MIKKVNHWTDLNSSSSNSSSSSSSWCSHRLRGSASPVAKVTNHFNRKLQNLTPRISQTP